MKHGAVSDPRTGTDQRAHAAPTHARTSAKLKQQPTTAVCFNDMIAVRAGALSQGNIAGPYYPRIGR